MLLGYARISSLDQDSAAQQRSALKAAGCKRIFSDEAITVGGSKHPALDEALATLMKGDVLIVWRLDRLGRSLPHLIQTIIELGERGAAFRSLSEAIDTTTSQAPTLFHVMGALADFERRLLTERTRAGLEAAKRRGTKLGRRPKLTAEKIEQAKHMIDTGESPNEVARTLGISLATLYRAIPAPASNRNTLDLFSGLSP
jgi:DNA invertase Pin-like site-specific DNA recombinase